MVGEAVDEGVEGGCVRVRVGGQMPVGDVHPDGVFVDGYFVSYARR